MIVLSLSHAIFEIFNINRTPIIILRLAFIAARLLSTPVVHHALIFSNIDLPPASLTLLPPTLLSRSQQVEVQQSTIGKITRPNYPLNLAVVPEANFWYHLRLRRHHRPLFLFRRSSLLPRHCYVLFNTVLAFSVSEHAAEHGSISHRTNFHAKGVVRHC